MKIITIHQPNYMPWLGFFHKWLMADAFVLLDTVQYHKNEWQNRNRIKTAQGEQWVTVPVTYRFPQRIHEVAIGQNNWSKKQIASIEQAYAKAKFLDIYWPPIKSILQKKHQCISQLNTELIQTLGRMLGCSSPLYLASDLDIDHEDPTLRLIAMTKHLEGDCYLSGSEGKSYLKTTPFEKENIKLLFQNITPPTYPQLHGEFIPYLSALDVLLNIGEDAKEVILNMGDMQP